MNDIELAKKQSIATAMTAIELAPLAADNEIALQTYTKIPLSRVTALGVGLEPVVAAVQQVASKGQAVSGYYKVTIPAGTHLAAFKDGTGLLGTAMDSNGIVSQARLNPLMCDPTMLFVAATMANIDKKLDAIQETQQEMLDFLVQKEKSALKGDLEFLIDIFNNYKYNWNNEKYKTANHIKALDIRCDAGKAIDFYREQIKSHVGKKAFLHSDHDVKKQMDRVMEEFKEYRLALYLYSFGYFIEVLLQENYEAAYLEAITKKIDDQSFRYRELYTKAYTQIEEYSRSSIQSKVLGGLSAVNKTAGETIAKIPIIRKSQIDETLIEAGKKIGDFGDRRVQTAMMQLIDQQSSCVRPFAENIEMMGRLYNSPMDLVFNDEEMYIGEAAERITGDRAT